jgi:5-oxoprolinase (ATP-hydrolysing) subunit A
LATVPEVPPIQPFGKDVRSIDINCDLGEGFGVYQAAPEAEIFPLISSANIACGFHAGDPQVMRRSVELAVKHGVAIGAHPGTPDLGGFGRRAIELSRSELENLLIYQIGALEAFCQVAGTHIGHVKPHGWLYNAAAREARMADTIAQTLKTMNPSWVLYGLAGSQLIRAAQEAGIPCAQEAFIDRTYQPDGSLTDRRVAGSLITEPAVAAQQALDLVVKGRVKTEDGGEVQIAAGTLCLHGDNPAVLPILVHVRECLSQNHWQICPLRTSGLGPRHRS